MYNPYTPTGMNPYLNAQPNSMDINQMLMQNPQYQQLMQQAQQLGKFAQNPQQFLPQPQLPLQQYLAKFDPQLLRDFHAVPKHQQIETEYYNKYKQRIELEQFMKSPEYQEYDTILRREIDNFAKDWKPYVSTQGGQNVSTQGGQNVQQSVLPTSNPSPAPQPVANQPNQV